MTTSTIADPRKEIDRLFRKYAINNPTQARRHIQERFTQCDLDRYFEALRILHGSGELG